MGSKRRIFDLRTTASGMVASWLAAVALGAAAFEDEVAEFSNFRLYGHISPAIVSFNDGVDRCARAVDNSYSGGRIGH